MDSCSTSDLLPQNSSPTCINLKERVRGVRTHVVTKTHEDGGGEKEITRKRDRGICYWCSYLTENVSRCQLNVYSYILLCCLIKTLFAMCISNRQSLTVRTPVRKGEGSVFVFTSYSI